MKLSWIEIAAVAIEFLVIIGIVGVALYGAWLLLSRHPDIFLVAALVVLFGYPMWKERKK